MREFLLRASKAFTKSFKLNDLPGAGRIDLVCRCITQAIWLSGNLRRNVVFRSVFEGPDKPPKLITVEASKLRGMSPDERNVASHLRMAIEKGYWLDYGEEIEVWHGIKVAKKSFEEFLRERSEEGVEIVYLHKRGKDVREVEFSKQVCFVLGDHKGLPKAAERFLKKIGAKRVSLGNKEYLASQCIAIINYELDRRNVD